MQVAGDADSGLVKELYSELRQLANRRIPGALNPDRGLEPLDIPRLIDLTQLLEPEQWQADRTAALMSVIKKATARLPSSRVRDGTDATWSHFAYAAYNLAGQSLVHVDGNRYAYLLDEFFGRAGLRHLSADTRRNDASKLRLKLAAALLAMKNEYLTGLASTSSSETEGEADNGLLQLQADLPRCALIDGAPLWTSSYVPRAAIQDQFSTYVSAGRRLITLVGQPGSGKSRAAYKLAEQHAQDAGLPGIWLDGSSEYLLRAGIIRHLQLTGMAVPEETDRLYLSFFAMLCGSPEVSAIILDNVSSPELLLRVVPRPPSALVLVTSERPCQPSFANGQVDVTPMLDDEALELASQLMPSVRQDSQRHLAYALGLLPLAITHAAGLLNGSFGINAEQLIELLDADPSEVLKIEVVQNHRALSVVYGSIVDRLHHEAPAAWQVLCILSAIHASNVPSGLVNDIFASLTEQGDGQPPLSAEAISGIATLKNMQIVQARDDGLSMNSLAWRLVASHMSSEHVRVARSAYPLLRQRLAEVRDATDTSSPPDVLYAAALGLMWNYSDDDTGSTNDERLGEMLAQIAAGLNRRGGSSDLLRWVMRSPLAREMTLSGRIQRPAFADLVVQLRPALVTGVALSPEPPTLYDGQTFSSKWLDLSEELDKELVATSPAVYFCRQHGLDPAPGDADIDQIAFQYPRELAVYEYGELSFLDDSAKWYADHGYWDEADARYDKLGELAAGSEHGGSSFSMRAHVGKGEVAVWRRSIGVAFQCWIALTDFSERLDQMPDRHAASLSEIGADFFRLVICNRFVSDGTFMVVDNAFNIAEAYRGAIEGFADYNDHFRMATAELKLAAFLAYKDLDAARECVANVGNYLDSFSSANLRRTVLSLKLQFLSGDFGSEQYELAWRCAAVATRILDWYWRAESLLIARLGGQRIGVKDDDLRLLDHAVRRAYNRLQRLDRISILERGVDSASSRVDLLTD